MCIQDDIWLGCLLAPGKAKRIQKREQTILFLICMGYQRHSSMTWRVPRKPQRFPRNLEVSIQFMIQTFNFVFLLCKLRINNPLLVVLSAGRANFNGKRKGLAGIAAGTSKTNEEIVCIVNFYRVHVKQFNLLLFPCPWLVFLSLS